jgi:hypothetical protein
VNRAGQDMLVITSKASYTDAAGDPIAENEETIIFVSLGQAS